MPVQTDPRLDLDDIQGDVLVGLQKHAELFLFFRIADAAGFKMLLRQHIAGRLTSTRRVLDRERVAVRERLQGPRVTHPWESLNLAFTKDGIDRLLGPGRALLDSAFERGADDPQTTAALNDPPVASWLPAFRSGRIDGVFLLAGPHRRFVDTQAGHLLARLSGIVAVVYAEMGHVRPGSERGHEHFGFLDGISQPAVRGLTQSSRRHHGSDQVLPGQDLVWPGEFVYGYPMQDADAADRPGPIAAPPAVWARNGSFMVVRRLEQLVPEFRALVAAEAKRLGMYPALLGSRMVGRWQSGAPLELAPLDDNPRIGADPMRNNDFDYSDDPFQRRCPYAAHIRKANPRDDPPRGKAQSLRHRIIRAAIPFGPEVAPGETRTEHSRGLIFVCYQIDIGRQFEFIQRRYADNPDFVDGKTRPDTGQPVHPGYDPIIGRAPDNGARSMDEPVPNYPTGNRRSSLNLMQQFVIPTAAGYFFVPSISAVRGALSNPG